jgi:aerobic-type carbon monoxide dehydrogenase small subunit (CoxS/CutS family)
MTTAKRKKVITIETIQRTVIHQNSQQTHKVWCQFCQAEVEMTTPELAAKQLRASVREIYRRIEKGEVHFIELENGQIFICLTKPNKGEF